MQQDMQQLGVVCLVSQTESAVTLELGGVLRVDTENLAYASVVTTVDVIDWVSGVRLRNPSHPDEWLTVSFWTFCF